MSQALHTLAHGFQGTRKGFYYARKTALGTRAWLRTPLKSQRQDKVLRGLFTGEPSCPHAPPWVGRWSWG